MRSLASRQGLDIGRIVVEGVAPKTAGGVERESTIGASQRGRNLEAGLASIDIRHRQRAARRGRAGDAIVHTTRLDNRTRGRAADRGRIIAAGDGDGDNLRRTVDSVNSEGFSKVLTRVERLHSGVVVVECEGPHTASGHRKLAIAMIAQRERVYGLKSIGRIVDIGVRQNACCSGHRINRVGNTTRLDDRARRNARDDGGIIQTGIVDSHRCPAQRSIAQANGVDERIVQVLRIIQSLQTGLECRAKR